MARKIIQIDAEKCIGCGLCTEACKQNTIEIIDGKAKVVNDDYCDGIGNCLPVCPVEAISFSDKDVKNTSQVIMATNSGATNSGAASSFSCPSNKVTSKTEISELETQSKLRQWPVQIRLVPATATFFDNADLLIAADCTAYAYANFHNKFMKDKITLIACPKLDACDYTEKLTQIFTENNIKSITSVRMDVPCCAGIEKATLSALKNSNKSIPAQIVTIATDGRILS